MSRLYLEFDEDISVRMAGMIAECLGTDTIGVNGKRLFVDMHIDYEDYEEYLRMGYDKYTVVESISDD